MMAVEPKTTQGRCCQVWNNNTPGAMIIMMILLTTLGVRDVEATDDDLISSVQLNLIHNVKVTALEVSETSTTSARSLIQCAAVCGRRSDCRSISFFADTGTCHANGLTMATAGADVTYDLGSVYAEIGARTEWKLAFRASQGISVSVLDTWNAAGRHDDEVTIRSHTIGCLTVDGRLPCDKHLRTWRLDEWTGVALAKHAFFTDSRQVFYVTFDAKETDSITRDQHFQIARIVDSSVAELVGYTGGANIASIVGNEHCKRRFHLSQEYGNCHTDRGWMIISDLDNQCCEYDHRLPRPTFLYSPTDHSVNIHSEAEEAQVYAVFLKYQD